MPKLSDLPTRTKDSVSEDDLKAQNVVLAQRLGDLQDKLYAQKKYGILIVLQGLDAAGKDNTVKHVFDSVNPSGCRVKSFKVPTSEEAAHDFLWRIHRECPEKGMLQIFNRSHYEDVLVPVVNGTLKGKELKQRYAQINAFEQMLTENGTLIFKFFLNVGPEEQKQRLDERLADPHKRYKYNPGDIKVFAQRKKYLKQYDEVFEHCKKAVPWHIIPADDKPYKNYTILKILLRELEKIDIDYPVEIPEED